MTARRRIMIRQVKEWAEILLPFEALNRYEILDEDGKPIGKAAEEGGGMGRTVGRQLLGASRKATLHVWDAQGNEQLRIEKPFRWYFHRVDVYSGERKLGGIQRRFSLIHRKFVIENAQGEEVLEIFSPLFRIWTFKVLFKGTEVGVVRKQWGGALKELFTDADVFGIEYDALPDLEALRPVLIAATFLIDFTCFENNQSSFTSWLPVGGD